jgi:phasin family protein
MATQRPKAANKNAERPTDKPTAKTAKVASFSTNQLNTLVQSGRAAAQKQMREGLEITVDNMERMNTNMMKNIEDMTSMNKDMFEAYVSCCTTWAKGCETISKSMMGTWQSAAQQYMQCCKSMLTAKTMKEAMDTQSDFVRSQIDTMMAESTKMSELCVKMASEASEPIQSQWTTMTSKYNQAA